MSGFDPIRVFRKLAYNNALANTRLYRACAALQPGEFEARRVSFFPSIKSTLNHILTVDWFYVDALEGGTLGLKAFDIEEPFDTLDALSVEQDKVDRRLVALCEHLNPEALVRVIDLHRGNRIQRERAEDVLSHLFQHQTHHRGQVHAMLAGSSVAPPQLDEFIVADDARFRGEELAALSWDETMLMR
ncbi:MULTISPECIES: DinB family protein [Rhizobium]|uniref:Putative damage-inducible protein DinB n=1 Tax=Rhizobium paranaense TaxID=1650438 RepID=A0A7W8XP00_9HYPH|nr:MULTISPECIES: DinB family protein [Rhizobium]MBB5572861.1 putative damage-inducible protein DinB [Rhizobium paranaense]PST61925.1 damage-inducible protein DinB [Rhizobium sp. SEMIA4064]